MLPATFVGVVAMIHRPGLIFPIENSPRMLQGAAEAMARRCHHDIGRGGFLKGPGFAVHCPDALAPPGFSAVTPALAARRCRKSFDLPVSVGQGGEGGS